MTSAYLLKGDGWTMDNDQQSGEATSSIVRSSFGHDQADYLLDLMTRKVSPSELQSLLLMVYDQIVSQRNPADVVWQYDNDRFVRPSDICQKKLTALDSLIFRIVPTEFEAIELSPVAPLGINAILAHTSQKNVLSTVRNIEVSGDITSSLAIESASRRRTCMLSNPRSTEEVNLCGSQRSIRLQCFENIPGFTSHFRVFGAVSAGRDVGHEEFEARNLIRHVGFYLDLLREANESGYEARNPKVTVSDIRIAEAIIANGSIDRSVVMDNTQNPSFDLLAHVGSGGATELKRIRDIHGKLLGSIGTSSLSYLEQIEVKAVESLRKQYPQAEIVFDIARTAGIGYYENLCFKISAENRNGDRFPLADGGLTDWTKRLLTSKKERLFISGFGSELFCRNYATE